MTPIFQGFRQVPEQPACSARGGRKALSLSRVTNPLPLGQSGNGMARVSSCRERVEGPHQFPKSPSGAAAGRSALQAVTSKSSLKLSPAEPLRRLRSGSFLEN